eukprot:CAMPEP_0202911134 /NCGR_PEP_ID=MMETSP1392-20130828/54161_1 /ASSEMBLY_ACC=CAM_ASM_000868 /TAXON_ID=225041 /ORGANISM="Chlamydomonas chlamydogama, Strain SAG 11-48b" /LENGTH=151 /DNA_ID=CAMNT_0049601529 /DNA_START=1235 /DNA_END=1690 /DNA_ORIENTATION=-
MRQQLHHIQGIPPGHAPEHGGCDAEHKELGEALEGNGVQRKVKQVTRMPLEAPQGGERRQRVERSVVDGGVAHCHHSQVGEPSEGGEVQQVRVTQGRHVLQLQAGQAAQPLHRTLEVVQAAGRAVDEVQVAQVDELAVEDGAAQRKELECE